MKKQSKPADRPNKAVIGLTPLDIFRRIAESNDQYFILRARAGTGKTIIANELVGNLQHLEWQVMRLDWAYNQILLKEGQVSKKFNPESPVRGLANFLSAISDKTQRPDGQILNQMQDAIDSLKENPGNSSSKNLLIVDDAEYLADFQWLDEYYVKWLELTKRYNVKLLFTAQCYGGVDFEFKSGLLSKIYHKTVKFHQLSEHHQLFEERG